MQFDMIKNSSGAIVQEQQFGGQQHQMRTNSNDVTHIVNRLKDARTVEEREMIFTDLRFKFNYD